MSDEVTSSALLEQLVYIDNYINGTQPNTDSSTATPNIDVDGQLSLDLAAFADDSFIFPDEDKPKHLYDHDEEEDDEDERGERGDHKFHKDGNLAGSGANDGLNGWNIHEFNSSSLLPTLKQEPDVGSSNQQFFRSHQFNDGHEDDSSRLDQFNLLSSHVDSNEVGLGGGGVLLDDFQNKSNHGHIGNKSDLDNSHHHVQPHKLLSINELPKFPVPPGAKNSLVSAGLSSNQIDLLSALIAQHQTNLGKTLSQQQKQRQQQGSAANGEHNTNGDDLGIQTINNFINKQSQQQQQQQQSTSSNLPSNIAPITPNAVALSPTDVSTRQSNPPFHLPSQQQPTSSLSQLNSSLQLQTRSRNPSITSFIDPNLQRAVGSGPTGPPSTTASSNLSSPDAAELDKKRRNTAASARFRIKKKMKEQQMENKINSLNEMISSLENKLSHLEMENKLLRNLIIEKGSQKSDDELRLLKERARRGNS
ncbi:hypothetical protein CANMA_003604 [Candida margitis]|uniref:uncharacterized protein n=1 Tax=Candida margitis TaxID=1775924 RepID=UPI002226F42F|nr:uncharacterized protein CANMA_003604 [Candida margitis]KAI5962829.1 hypothetical protein CANMA_003604 [Candida margitis]